MKMLLRVSHGMGDNAQFVIVLKHIKHYRPKWKVDLEIAKGNSSFFTGLCNKIYTIDTLTLKLLRYVKYCKWISRRKDYHGIEIKDSEIYKKKYDRIFDIFFPVPKISFSDVPSTKVTWCLTRMFHMKPNKKLYKYRVHINKADRKKVDTYVGTLPTKDYVLIHYISKTLRQRKSLTDEDTKNICDLVIKKGYIPVILDWKEDSPLPDQKTIFCPGGNNPLWSGNTWAEAGTLAALIERAKLYIGVDSGPLHVAGATQTPTLAIWRKHHPVNYFDLADNVLHLLPNDIENIQGTEPKKARRFFEENYNHQYYKDIHKELLDTIDNML